MAHDLRASIGERLADIGREAARHINLEIAVRNVSILKIALIENLFILMASIQAMLLIAVLYLHLVPGNL